MRSLFLFFNFQPYKNNHNMWFLIWSKQWTEVAEEPRVKAVEVGKDRKFYSQCCINMFSTVELICISSICYDTILFCFPVLWKCKLMIDCWYAHKLVTFILLLVPGLGKMTLYNSLLFIFCFCLSSVVFFWLFSLCIRL